MSSQGDRWRQDIEDTGIYKKGKWFQASYKLLNSFDNLVEGVFLSVVLHQVCLEIEKDKDRDLWVRIPNRRIRGKISSFSDVQIKKYFCLLRKRGLLQTTVFHKSGRDRWVKIDPKNIRRWLKHTKKEKEEDRVPKDMVPKSPIGVMVPTGTMTGGVMVPVGTVLHGETFIKEGESFVPRDLGTPKKRVKIVVGRIVPTPEEVHAQRLHEMVHSVRKVVPASNPKEWPTSFKSLHRRGVPHERISQVLSWYRGILREHGDLILRPGLFLPVAYSGKSFLEKWDKLEQAMERDKDQNGNIPTEYAPPPIKKKKKIKINRTLEGKEMDDYLDRLP